jgi:hypothetical protein
VGVVDTNPVWTKDGKYVLFLSSRSGTMNVWAVEIATKSMYFHFYCVFFVFIFFIFCLFVASCRDAGTTEWLDGRKEGGQSVGARGNV